MVAPCTPAHLVLAWLQCNPKDAPVIGRTKHNNKNKKKKKKKKKKNSDNNENNIPIEGRHNATPNIKNRSYVALGH